MRRGLTIAKIVLEDGDVGEVLESEAATIRRTFETQIKLPPNVLASRSRNATKISMLLATEIQYPSGNLSIQNITTEDLIEPLP